MADTTAENAHPRTPAARRPHRHIALLGGTTSWVDALEALSYIIAARRLVNGPAIADYERAFAARIGVAHATSFATGRVGLYGLLRALGIGPGDEVLVQAPTHIVVANAIRYTGASPVYVDCELDTYNLDLEQAEKRVTARAKALILQHTFGIPVNLERALALAEAHGLAVIEDCVHSLGACYRGKPVGGFGQAAFFSTEETKTLSTTMGGMVVTNEAELAARLTEFQHRCAPPPASLVARYLLKLALYHLLTEPHVHAYARATYERLGQRTPLPRPTSAEELRGARPNGYERRLANAQAALALRQLRRLDENVHHRAQIAKIYRTRLADQQVRLPQPPPDITPSWVRYPVWVDDRETVVRATARHAVLGTWFTSVLEEAASPAAGDYLPGSCPRAEDAARHLINLPTHPRVRPHDAETLAAIVAEATG